MHCLYFQWFVNISRRTSQPRHGSHEHVRDVQTIPDFTLQNPVWYYVTNSILDIFYENMLIIQSILHLYNSFIILVKRFSGENYQLLSSVLTITHSLTGNYYGPLAGKNYGF